MRRGKVLKWTCRAYKGDLEIPNLLRSAYMSVRKVSKELRRGRVTLRNVLVQSGNANIPPRAMLTRPYSEQNPRQ